MKAFSPAYKVKLFFHFLDLHYILYHDEDGAYCYRWLGMMHAMTFQNISDSFPFQNCYNLWERKPLMSCTYTFIYDKSWKCGLIRGMQMCFLCAVLDCVVVEVIVQRGWCFSLSLFLRFICASSVLGSQQCDCPSVLSVKASALPFSKLAKSYKVSQLFLKTVSPFPATLYSYFFENHATVECLTHADAN